MDCVFCKISNKEIPADIVAEDREFLVFKDINPKAPVHLIIIPKTHFGPVSALGSDNENLLGGLILKAKDVASTVGVSENGYRLIFNVGRDAGMEIDHLHLHLLAGKPLKF
ncbi:MAG: histidine triad nucleotide-binding protein [Parcubacteria group bacterium]|nr:histidine triad nucleotide-binding protein [Parcubacteria group bacterium]